MWGEQQEKKQQPVYLDSYQFQYCKYVTDQPPLAPAISERVNGDKLS